MGAQAKFKAENRRELAKMLRQKDAAALLGLRSQIAEVKRGKRERLRALSQQCKEARVMRSQSVIERRAAFRSLVLAEKAQDKAQCQASKERAREQVERALGELAAKGAEVREVARLVKGRTQVVRSAVARAESDDEVKGNIPHRMLPVWKVRAPQTKATDRATRTEVFAEWVEENPAIVAEILEADTDRELRRLVAEERRLHKETKKASRYSGDVSHRVEGHEEEWGAPWG